MRKTGSGRGLGLAMMQVFRGAWDQTFTSGLPGLAPLPQVSLSTRLLINNSGLSIDLFTCSATSVIILSQESVFSDVRASFVRRRPFKTFNRYTPFKAFK